MALIASSTPSNPSVTTPLPRRLSRLDAGWHWTNLHGSRCPLQAEVMQVRLWRVLMTGVDVFIC